ncbi:hypothetical protein U879_05115 [Defluviimonas sp. 20V17]|nr:hypothetical protein U879_05115 [Defluviimonas sp. 20V17]
MIAAQTCPGIFFAAQDVARHLDHLKALRRRLRRACAAVENSHAKLVFQGLDLLAYGRWCEADYICCLREGAVGLNGKKCSELSRVHQQIQYF